MIGGTLTQAHLNPSASQNVTVAHSALCIDTMKYGCSNDLAALALLFSLVLFHTVTLAVPQPMSTQSSVLQQIRVARVL